MTEYRVSVHYDEIVLTIKATIFHKRVRKLILLDEASVSYPRSMHPTWYTETTW